METLYDFGSSASAVLLTSSEVKLMETTVVALQAYFSNQEKYTSYLIDRFLCLPHEQLLTSSEVKLMETFCEKNTLASMASLNFFWSEINGNVAFDRKFQEISENS